MTEQVTETYFLPEEIERQQTRIPASLYNLAHNLVARSEHGCVFVPLRYMQVLAVITTEEIIFVDSLSYASQDGEGGRIIQLAWQCKPHRDALDAPVECDVVYYHESGRQTQPRLVREFGDALSKVDEYYRQQDMPANGARIIALRRA